MAVVNTLSFYDTATIVAVKSFIAHAQALTVNNRQGSKCLPLTNTLAYFASSWMMGKTNQKTLN
jgi:hypothetical protein